MDVHRNRTIRGITGPRTQNRGGGSNARLLTIVAVLAVLFALIIGVLLHFHIPSNSAGLAAQTVCSGTFVSGRNAEDVFTQDVLPQSPTFALVSNLGRSLWPLSDCQVPWAVLTPSDAAP